MTRKQIFERILKDLRFLITVVYSKFPKEEFNIEQFKTAEKNLKIFMLMYCPWVKWPPYFHLLSHCAELLEKYESIGRGSTESKERKNKTMMEYFNFFAKKTSNCDVIMDVYLRDWYATSPYLHDIGVPKKIVHCSHCKIFGHLVHVLGRLASGAKLPSVG